MSEEKLVEKVVEFDVIINDRKYTVKIVDPNQSDIERLRGNAFARIYYSEMLKEQFKQARINALKLTNEKLQELGLVSDRIIRGRPENKKGNLKRGE